jgi:CheY-like chemotaxis protein
MLARSMQSRQMLSGQMLSGKSILVVEDEPIVAMMLEEWLEDLGARVVGPAGTVAEALALVDSTHIDVALLDVNLGNERSGAVADRLRERGVPFVFATGYAHTGDDPDFGAEVLMKPYGVEQVEAALARSMARA